MPTYVRIGDRVYRVKKNATPLDRIRRLAGVDKPQRIAKAHRDLHDAVRWLATYEMVLPHIAKIIGEDIDSMLDEDDTVIAEKTDIRGFVLQILDMAGGIVHEEIEEARAQAKKELK
jgi:hypothetical protein